MPSAAQHRTPFVGRADEQLVIRRAFAAAAAGDAQVVFVSGETGIGKTRLVDEFIASLEPNVVVLRGAAPVLFGQRTPFAPIVGILRGVARLEHEGHVEEWVPADSELGQLLPNAEQPSVDALDTQSASRGRMFEQCLALFARLGGEFRPVVVVLEDLHWADDSTLDLVSYVVRNLADAPVLLICTNRATGPFGVSAFDRLVLEAARTPSVARVELSALSSDETVALITAATGAGYDQATVAQLAGKSGGNPLFAERLTAHGSPQHLSPSLVGIVRLPVTALSQPALRVAHAAAIAGVAVPASILEPVASALGGDAAAAVDEVLEAGILRRERESGTTTYVFRHPLDQEVIEADLSEVERTHLHRLLAETISARTANRSPTPSEVVALARHWTASSEFARAYPWLVRAAQAAESVFAFAEADRSYEAALEALPYVWAAEADNGRRGDERRSLIERSAQAASLAGAPTRSLSLIDALESTDGPDARLLALRAQYLWETGRHSESITTYRSAVSLISSPPSNDSVGVLRAASRTALIAGEFEQARDWARQAIEIARGFDNDAEARDALYTLGAALAHLGEEQAAEKALSDARAAEARRRKQSAIAPQPSRIADMLAGYWSRAVILNRQGQPEDSAEAALEGVRRATELGAVSSWGGVVGTVAVEQLIGLGRWAEASTLAEQVIAQHPGESSAPRAAQAYLFALTGRISEGFAALSVARDSGPTADSRDPRYEMFMVRAETELALATNQLAEAFRMLEEALSQPPHDADARDRAELCALSLRVLADRTETTRFLNNGPELVELLERAAQLDGELVSLSLSSVDAKGKRSDPRFAAIAAWGRCEYRRATGESSAEAWLELASDWQQIKDRYRRAYAQLRAGETQLATRHGRDAARSVLSEARGATLEIGAEPLRREIEALAKRSRLDIDRAAAVDTSHDRESEQRSGDDERRQAPAFGLSAREIEVLTLVADGRTNKQIGVALFISEKTAGHHVSNILGKLGVASRVEAAAIAVKVGIAGTPSAIAQEFVSGTADVSTSGDMRVQSVMMFTDIVTSTALLQAIGDDSWSNLVRWHDTTLRALFRAYLGHEIDHAGDGFFVRFPDIVSAIDCAIAIQRTLADHRRQHGFAPRLRIGIHSAEVVTDGQTLRGRGVHVAARIGQAAVGDEILVSAASVAALGGRYATSEPKQVTASGLSGTLTVIAIEWGRTSP